MSSKNKTATNTKSASPQEVTTKGGEKLFTAQPETEIDELYHHYQILADAGVNAEQHQDSYKYILNAVDNGSERAKILACQFIPKFFKYFDKLAPQAINAQLDLCEEESRNIRINAIKGLPLICEDKKEHVGHISNVLGQLLVEEEKVELDVIKTAFTHLFKIDTAAALQALFQQIRAPDTSDSSEGAKLREQAILFLNDKVMDKEAALVHPYPDIEKLISTEIQKLLPTASETEFGLFVQILRQLGMYSDNSGKKILLDLLEQQGLNTEKPFDPQNTGALKKLLQILDLAVPILKQLQQSGPFFIYLVEQVLPKIGELSSDSAVLVLRSIATSSITASADNARSALPIIYKRLITELENKDEEGKSYIYNFTNIEIYLFTFHQLGLKVPGSMNAVCGIKIYTGQPTDDMGDYSAKREHMVKLLKELETRCAKLQEGLTAVIKQAKTTGTQSTSTETKTEETDAPSTAEKEKVDIDEVWRNKRMLKNVTKMSKELSKNKPSFVKYHEISPSWKPRVNKFNKRSAQSAGLSGEPPKKKQRQDKKEGKKHGENRDGKGGRGGRGGRGRGRGRGRGSRN